VIDEEIGNIGIVESLPTRIADMDRGFHTREELDEVNELRIAARVTATADSDFLDLAGHHLEASEDVIRNLS